MQKNSLFRNNQTRCTLSVPEIKILILTIYFIIFSVILTTCISLGIEYSDDYFDNLYLYFYCQLHGYNSVCDELKEQYEQFHYPHLTSMVMLMLGATTCVNLIFAIKFQDMQDFFSKITTRIEMNLFKTKSSSANDTI